MTLEQAEAIVEALEREGASASVYPDYSGRGMFGKTCVGIVTDSPALVGFVVAELGFPKDALPRRRDSLGLETILY